MVHLNWTCCFSLWTTLVLLPPLCCALQRVQKTNLTQTEEAKRRAVEVKGAFLQAFNDYMTFGFPADEVRPVTKVGKSTRNGWSASLVDALDTLFVMDLQTEFEKAIAATLKIDFSRSQVDQGVSVFETTIRYIGGMLSAYELSGSKNTLLLDQARKLGDKLLLAWQNNQQNLPFAELNFTTNKPTRKEVISVASAGSMIIEFDRLSLYTKDPKYLQLASKAMKTVMGIPSTFPGIPGFVFGVMNQTIMVDLVTWGGGADSYLEYLLKYALLINNADTSYQATWRLAVKSSIENLIQVSPSQNLTYLADYSSSHNGIDYTSSHLACFAGKFHNPQNECFSILTQRSFIRWQLASWGQGVQRYRSLHYRSTATGIGPEIFRFLGPQGQITAPKKPTPSDMTFFQTSGFYIDDAAYLLRPEVVESAFYAWRLTGDTRYQEFVYDVFKVLLKYCKAPVSFSAIKDVNSPNPMLSDDSESFFFAETFKYIYLTFSDPALLSLDEYVFNTEAHPFRYLATQDNENMSRSRASISQGANIKKKHFGVKSHWLVESPATIVYQFEVKMKILYYLPDVHSKETEKPGENKTSITSICSYLKTFRYFKWVSAYEGHQYRHSNHPPKFPCECKRTSFDIPLR
ncbi:hypothetical protein O181_045645 [Austropuccinia psidii MF-1]|uniref:alpha-1,2-Mannosidase n=1 Tax=Austropuccinia psidii MF-1 TaxID=1389203 RepID=A0A9Q3HLE3_9BASI|nr:hypothetical protein [Austropuccinia psidii MF-1]